MILHLEYRQQIFFDNEHFNLQKYFLCTFNFKYEPTSDDNVVIHYGRKGKTSYHDSFSKMLISDLKFKSQGGSCYDMKPSNNHDDDSESKRAFISIDRYAAIITFLLSQIIFIITELNMISINLILHRCSL